MVLVLIIIKTVDTAKTAVVRFRFSIIPFYTGELRRHTLRYERANNLYAITYI